MSHYTTGITGYVDVYDCVEAMIKLIESDVKNERFILVAKNLSFQQFQEKVATALGARGPFARTRAKAGRDRRGSDPEPRSAPPTRAGDAAFPLVWHFEFIQLQKKSDSPLDTDVTS